MAQFTRTHGDAQPVFAIDVQNGPVAPTASADGTTTNFSDQHLTSSVLT